MSRPESGRYQSRRLGRRLAGPLFATACLLATLSGVIVLVVVLGSVVNAAMGHHKELGRPQPAKAALVAQAGEILSFLWSLTGRIEPADPELDHEYGYRVGIVGTLWLLGLVAVIGIPVGIGAAVFLEEYTPQGLVRRAIQTNIANLAGVPSVVYGLLGLAVFRDAFGNPQLALGATLWAGGLTLSLLVLPMVVIATQEAIRSVPNSLRQAALALGATRWLTVRDHVLPAAFPGIMTGTILALSRAIGETAPLVLVGAATSLLVTPRTPSDSYTALPVQIYVDALEAKDPYHTVAAGGILILLALLMTMNAGAIFLRNHFGRHRRG